MALAPDDPAIANSLGNLGVTVLRGGRGREGYRGAGFLDLLAEALAIQEAAFPDNPGHPSRTGTANSLAIAHRALAALGPPITGTLPPDLDAAEALEARYVLDTAKIEKNVEDIIARTRLYESGEEPPPWGE